MPHRYDAIVANTYGPLLERVWRRALLMPGYEGLFESLASEVGDFLGLSQAAAERAMVEAWQARPATSRSTFPTVLNEASLAEFYSDSSTSMLVSAFWHSLRADRYALHSVAALHATEMYSSGDRIFELGHGIGSTSVLFAKQGLRMTIGDVSDRYIDFARHRLATRSLDVVSLDLRDRYPEPGSQDVVVCLDVLEHVLEPLGLVHRMVECLAPDGLLVLNVAFGKDSDTPEHLLHRRFGFLNRFRGMGLEPIPHPTLQLFWRRDQRAWERPLRMIQDGVVVGAQDIGATLPRVRRFVNRTVSPSL